MDHWNENELEETNKAGLMKLKERWKNVVIGRKHWSVFISVKEYQQDLANFLLNLMPRKPRKPEEIFKQVIEDLFETIKPLLKAKLDECTKMDRELTLQDLKIQEKTGSGSISYHRTKKV